MARERRLLKQMLEQARKNIESVSYTAEPAMVKSELDKLDEAIGIIFQVEKHIDKIKEEFIKTIDECTF